jgi:hypothetical protein
MAERWPPEVIRHGFEQEVRNERDNCLRAVAEVEDELSRVRERLEAGRVPVAELRQLVTAAAEAYQRAAAWAALDRVRFMLPGDSETKEG